VPECRARGRATSPIVGWPRTSSRGRENGVGRRQVHQLTGFDTFDRRLQRFKDGHCHCVEADRQDLLQDHDVIPHITRAVVSPIGNQRGSKVTASPPLVPPLDTLTVNMIAGRDFAALEHCRAAGVRLFRLRNDCKPLRVCEAAPVRASIALRAALAPSVKLSPSGSCLVALPTFLVVAWNGGRPLSSCSRSASRRVRQVRKLLIKMRCALAYVCAVNPLQFSASTCITRNAQTDFVALVLGHRLAPPRRQALGVKDQKE
jgi:hypothetical protein